MELVLVRNLCGTFCFSTQFVIFMDLLSTVILPIAITPTYFLIGSMAFSLPWTFEEAISLVLLITVLIFFSRCNQVQWGIKSNWIPSVKLCRFTTIRVHLGFCQTTLTKSSLEVTFILRIFTAPIQRRMQPRWHSSHISNYTLSS